MAAFADSHLLDGADEGQVPIFPVCIQGPALSLGLIVAIGAQNAFVLRQGLRREHVGSVVLFCAAADAMLIAAGVMGMAQALGQSPNLARALALAVYGWQALRRARHLRHASTPGRLSVNPDSITTYIL